MNLDGREQFNQASAYIDGSMIYATTHLESNVRLMSHTNGNLRARLNVDGRWMLPIDKDPKDGCNREEQMNISRYCFKAGKRPRYLVIKTSKPHMVKGILRQKSRENEQRERKNWRYYTGKSQNPIKESRQCGTA